MTIYECEECAFVTNLKYNYGRHMVSKKHCFMTDTVLNDSQLKKQKDVALRNRQDYDKIRTPENIKKHNKSRRDKWKNDEIHRLKKLKDCRHYYDENREKVNLRNSEYQKKNRKKINEYRKKYFIEKWWTKIISSAKTEDKKYNRRSTIRYIDKDFLIEQKKKQNNKCIYCKCEMTGRGVDAVRDTKITCERMNNKQDHNILNCVLSCLKCNVRRRDSYSFKLFKMKIEIEQMEKLSEWLDKN